MCNNKDLLVSYLYDDVTADERRTFEAHMQRCAECREELASMGMTRAHLATWAPPERALGFRMISDAPPQAAAKVMPFRSRWTPAFGRAAAAVLVLAAATAIANLEIRYDDNGLVVRTGWARSVDVASIEPAAPPAGDANGIAQASWRADFDALEARLQQMERVVTTRPAAGALAVNAGQRMSDAEMLRQVRAIVKDAESRQQVAVAQRLLQVIGDLDRRHRADIATLQQGLGQYQGLTDMQILNTREQINELKRVATRQEK